MRHQAPISEISHQQGNTEEPMRSNSLTYICDIRPQSVKSVTSKGTQRNQWGLIHWHIYATSGPNQWNQSPAREHRGTNEVQFTDIYMRHQAPISEISHQQGNTEEPMRSNSLTYICDIRPQSVKSVTSKGTQRNQWGPIHWHIYATSGPNQWNQSPAREHRGTNEV